MGEQNNGHILHWIYCFSLDHCLTTNASSRFDNCRESFSLRDLSDCSVFLLDYASEVDVTNCVNCQIFIGPVDGPAILDSCHNCNVAVACQQFQAKGCSECAFNLFTTIGPTLSGCSNIKVSCWTGAYAGLNAHFAAAHLDPTKNQWNRVYDASATEGQGPNFVLSEAPAEAWVVSIEGAEGGPENPVPSSNGTFPPVDAQSAPLDPADFPTENGSGGPTAADAAAGYEFEAPTTEVARDKLHQRLVAQAKEEADKRTAAQAAAARYLEEFYEKRNSSRDKRIAAGRDQLAKRGSSEIGPEGDSLWEKAISMIDFNAARPGGTDLSRFKSVLFACKERARTLAA